MSSTYKNRIERINLKLEKIKSYKKKKNASKELIELIDMVVGGISLIVSSKDK